MNKDTEIVAFKLSGDVAAMGVLIGALMTVMPAIASVLSVIWIGIRIFETETFQKLIRRWKKENPTEKARDRS